MIVFVEEDGHGPIAGPRASVSNHLSNSDGIRHTIAVQEQKIGYLNNVVRRDRATSVACTNEQRAAAARLLRFYKLDQLVYAIRPEHRVIVSHVALIIY